MSISVVVPTCNRNELLNRCIKSLIDQKLQPNEIIIVDNSTHKFAKPVYKKLKKNYERLRYVWEKRSGVSYARNSGIIASKFNIIACIDDDCIAAHDWLEKGLKGYKHHPQSIIVGKSISKNSLYADVDYYLSQTVFEYYKKGYMRFVDTKNCILNKDLLLQNNLFFDTSLPYYFEDLDFSNRLHDVNIPIYYDPAMSIKHHDRGKVVDLLKREWIKGHSFYLYNKKWQKSRKNIVYKYLKNQDIKTHIRTEYKKRNLEKKLLEKKIFRNKSFLYRYTFIFLLILLFFTRSCSYILAAIIHEYKKN